MLDMQPEGLEASFKMNAKHNTMCRRDFIAKAPLLATLLLIKPSGISIDIDDPNIIAVSYTFVDGIKRLDIKTTTRYLAWLKLGNTYRILGNTDWYFFRYQESYINDIISVYSFQDLESRQKYYGECEFQHGEYMSLPNTLKGLIDER